MRYVERNLRDNEHVVAEAHVTYWAIVPIILRTLLIIGLFWAILEYGMDYLSKNFEFNNIEFKQVTDAASIIFIAATVFAVIGAIIPIIRLMCIQLVATDKKLVGKTGFIYVHTLDTYLEKIDNFTINETILGRIFRYNTITVGTTSSTMKFRYIGHAKKFKNAVMDAYDARLQYLMKKEADLITSSNAEYLAEKEEWARHEAEIAAMRAGREAEKDDFGNDVIFVKPEKEPRPDVFDGLPDFEKPVDEVEEAVESVTEDVPEAAEAAVEDAEEAVEAVTEDAGEALDEAARTLEPVAFEAEEAFESAEDLVEAAAEDAPETLVAAEDYVEKDAEEVAAEIASAAKTVLEDAPKKDGSVKDEFKLKDLFEEVPIEETPLNDAPAEDLPEDLPEDEDPDDFLIFNEVTDDFTTDYTDDTNDEE
ncbi:MAG: PH domain-containing protein [Lachnospiraceae bacterium]|nr:PH domain-containing protein [Lachnospiraceae bacterium]